MKLAAKKTLNKRPLQSVLLFSFLFDAVSKCKLQMKKIYVCSTKGEHSI